jgi:hypothetical protein
MTAGMNFVDCAEVSTGFAPMLDLDLLGQANLVGKSAWRSYSHLAGAC